MIEELEALDVQRLAVEELRQWCEGLEVDVDSAIALGYVDSDAAYITDDGITAAHAANIPLRRVSLMTLGSPIAAYTSGRNPIKVVLQAGSKLLVTFGGRDKQKRRFYEVFVSNEFPILVVYANTAHEIQEDYWPLGRPIPTHFLVADNA